MYVVSPTCTLCVVRSEMCAQGGMLTHVKWVCMWDICVYVRYVHMLCVYVWCILCDEHVCCLAGVEWWVCRVNMLCGVCVMGMDGDCAVCVCVCVYTVACAHLGSWGQLLFCLPPGQAQTQKGACTVKDVGDTLDTQGCTRDRGHACIQFCRVACIWNPSCPLLSTNPGPGEQTTAAPW